MFIVGCKTTEEVRREVVKEKYSFLNDLRKIKIASIEVSSAIREINNEERSYIINELRSMVETELKNAGYGILPSEEQASLNIKYFETRCVSFAGFGGSVHSSAFNELMLDIKLINKKYGEITTPRINVNLPETLPSVESTFNSIKGHLEGEIKKILPFREIRTF